VSKMKMSYSFGVSNICM